MHGTGDVDHPQFPELRAKIARGLVRPSVVGPGPYPDGLHLWEPRTQSHLLAFFFPDLEEPPFGKTGTTKLIFWWPDWGPEQQVIASRLGLPAPDRIMVREFDREAWEETLVERPSACELEFGDASIAARAGLSVAREVFGMPKDRWLFITSSHNPDDWPYELPIPDPWPPT